MHSLQSYGYCLHLRGEENEAQSICCVLKPTTLQAALPGPSVFFPSRLRGWAGPSLRVSSAVSGRFHLTTDATPSPSAVVCVNKTERAQPCSTHAVALFQLPFPSDLCLPSDTAQRKHGVDLPDLHGLDSCFGLSLPSPLRPRPRVLCYRTEYNQVEGEVFALNPCRVRLLP